MFSTYILEPCLCQLVLPGNTSHLIFLEWCSMSEALCSECKGRCEKRRTNCTLDFHRCHLNRLSQNRCNWETDFHISMTDLIHIDWLTSYTNHKIQNLIKLLWSITCLDSSKDASYWKLFCSLKVVLSSLFYTHWKVSLRYSAERMAHVSRLNVAEQSIIQLKVAVELFIFIKQYFIYSNLTFLLQPVGDIALRGIWMDLA